MEKEGFSDEDVVLLLHGLFGKNDTSVKGDYNDSNIFLEDPQSATDHDIPIGLKFYAYLTPLIIVFGLFGNILALVVYVMPQMRRFGLCLQLAAVALSDSVVLLIYVLPEWLTKGLPVLGQRAVHVIHIEGVCHTFLFLSYMSRAVSAWLLASFSVQQCLLLFGNDAIQRSKSRTFAGWMIGGTFIASAVASIYKPILSGIHPHHGVCGSLPEHSKTSFILDVTYGLSISVLPSIVIIVANGAILILFLRRRHHFIEAKTHLHGFAVTIIVTTLAYVCLNIPYFIVWIRFYVMAANGSRDDLDEGHAHLHHHTRLRSDIYFTRMLFYVNFAIKVLLYGITAKRFRQQTKSLCGGQNDANDLEDITMETPRTVAS